MSDDNPPFRRTANTDGGEGISWYCPGCNEFHGVPVKGGEVWSWNGDMLKPTLKPSVRIRGKRMPTDEEADRIIAGEKVELPDRCCHLYIRAGMCQFLGDCTHDLAGQTVEIKPCPWFEDTEPEG